MKGNYMNIEKQALKILQNASSATIAFEKIKPLLRSNTEHFENLQIATAERIYNEKIEALENEIFNLKRASKIIVFPSEADDSLIALGNAIEALNNVPIGKLLKAQVLTSDNEVIDSVTAIGEMLETLANIGSNLYSLNHE